MMTPERTRLLSHGGMATAYAIAIIHFLLHVFTNGAYGMFRDEFYYIACSEHLAWGYVDHPPLSIALLSLSRLLSGDSVVAIRILPALAGAIVVVMGARLSRELGGGQFAQALSALAIAVAPLYLVQTGFYSMNAFDLLFWMAAYIIMVRILKTGSPKPFLLLGVIIGLGLLNKLSMATCALGLAVGLFLVSQRRLYRNKCLWFGGFLAAILFLPHLIWQVQNGWPTLEFIENAKRYKIAGFSVAGFLAAQVLQIHPFNAPTWVIGLVSLLFVRRFSRYRALGIAFLASLIFLVVQQSKTYYIGPAFPLLLAAGSCTIETALGAENHRWVRTGIFALVLVGGILTLPLAVPVLPVERLIVYRNALGLRPAQEETSGVGVLDQHYADRFGWETMVATIASVYDSLPEPERDACAILARNYGEAGAVDYYGPRSGLPKAISGHNNYYLWGPGNISGDVVVAVGFSRVMLQPIFSDVTTAAVIVSPFAMPYESDMPVYVCRDLKISLAEAWQMMRLFI